MASQGNGAVVEEVEMTTGSNEENVRWRNGGNDDAEEVVSVERAFDGVRVPSWTEQLTVRPGAGPSLTTLVYETHLGLAALTWSRIVLGLSLRVILRPYSYADDDDEEEEELLRFRIRPWLLWKRRGRRRFHLKDRRRHHRYVDFTWDLVRASYSRPGAAPNPSSISTGVSAPLEVTGEREVKHELHGCRIQDAASVVVSVASQGNRAVVEEVMIGNTIEENVRRSNDENGEAEEVVSVERLPSWTEQLTLSFFLSFA
ncbi:hypothetical protein Cni_G11634 [Canna indica]|uniref:Uncharacterized protein n=1 Tax=Canna indica TaxID=4628 RepID=A0AAQ3K8E6_9LILI|nr:hypothetical protein Cni_G11634 [Canna indica]